MVYIYIRVSSKKQQEKGYSLEEQEKAGKSFADSMGQPYALYKDVQSGAESTRKGWKALLSDIETNATDQDTLWYGSQSRLSRDAEDFQHFKKFIKSKGIKLFERRQNRYIDFKNKGDSLIAGVQAVIDEGERDELIARIKEGMGASFNAGNRIHPRIYGYKPDGFDSKTGNMKWKVVKEEADLIRYVYDLYVNRRMSVRGIITKVNSEGFRARNGKLWTHNLIRLLTKSVYTGMTWNNEKQPVKSNLYEPIVPLRLFREAQNRYLSRKQKAQKGRHPAHLGTTILRCPKCGVPYCRVKKREKSYYLHRHYSKCDAVRKLVKYEVANFLLGEAFTMTLSLYGEEIARRLKGSLGDEELVLKNDLLRIEAQIKRKQTEIDNFNAAIAEGAVTQGNLLQNFVSQIGKRLSEIRELEKQRDKIQEKISLQSTELEYLVASVSLTNLFHYYDPKTTDLERRELLKPVIKQALVFQDEIIFESMNGFHVSMNYPNALRDYREKGLRPTFSDFMESCVDVSERQKIKKWRTFVEESEEIADAITITDEQMETRKGILNAIKSGRDNPARNDQPTA